MPEYDLGRIVGRDGVTPNIQIAEVLTLNADEEAYFNRLEDSPDSSPVFEVGIPRGVSGLAPDITIGETTTLPPGSSATVTRREDSTNAKPVFDFGIPTGETGSPGPQGNAPAKSILVTESITLGEEHANSLLIVNSDVDVIIVIPTHASVAFEDHAELEIYKMGEGTVTFSTQTGVTVLCKEDTHVMSEKYTSAALKLLTAYDASNNTWSLEGAVG